MKNLVKEFKVIFSCKFFTFDNYNKKRFVEAASLVNMMKEKINVEDLNYICTLNAFLNLVTKRSGHNLNEADLRAIYDENVIPALNYLEEKYTTNERDEVIKDFKIFLDKNREKITDSVVAIEDLSADDPWIVDNDKMYEQNVNEKTV